MPKVTNTPLEKAERAVIRAAMGCVNENGFAFEERGMGGAGNCYLAIRPDALRRLERAIANLKEVRRKK